MSLINLNRRGFLRTTALATVASALPFGMARAEPKRGGNFRIAIGGGQTTDTLNPGTWDNTFNSSIGFGIHGRLTEVAPDGSLVPELAESWEASSDAAEWTFKLRKGVTFHSGKTLDGQDVVNSINFHRGKDSTSAAGPLVAAIQDISVDGDTVKFKLDGGNADFPFILSDYHLVICKTEGDSIDWKSGDGCGSYMLKEFKPGISARLERNPNHWRSDVGWFDSVEMLSVVDVNARTTALISGDVHAIDRVELKTVSLINRNPKIKINSVAGTQHYDFAMSTNQDPFKDNNVRQALKYAINREEMVEKILFGYGSVGNDVPIGRNQRYFNKDLAQKTYDPDKAKHFLKQAGLDSLDVALSAADAAFPGAVDAATLFQNSAKAANINVKVIREPNDGYWSDVWMKKPFSAVYWSGRPVEDQAFSIAYACKADWNDTFWCNDKFMKLLAEARSELDENKRRAMYYEMQDILSNDGGAIIPMFANYVFANADTVSTPENLASNWDLDGMRFMERWWFA